MDEEAARRAAKALEGTNSGCQDFKADEADGWSVAPASSQARHRPRPPALEVHRVAEPLSPAPCIDDAHTRAKAAEHTREHCSI